MKKFLFFLLILAVLVGGAAWYFTSFKMDIMIKQKVDLEETRKSSKRC